MVLSLFFQQSARENLQVAGAVAKIKQETAAEAQI